MLFQFSQVLCEMFNSHLRPHNPYHNGYDFDWPVNTKRILHRFPDFTVGGFWISPWHCHKPHSNTQNARENGTRQRVYLKA